MGMLIANNAKRWFFFSPFCPSYSLQLQQFFIQFIIAESKLLASLTFNV